MTKTFELTLRLRNNILKQFRQSLGMSAEQVAAAIGVSPGLYYRCEGLSWFPLRSSPGEKQWKPSAILIARFFGVEPEEIWPDEVLMVTHPLLVREMSAAELGPLLSTQQEGVSIGMLEAAPDEMIAKYDLTERLDMLLRSLSRIQEDVVRQRIFKEKAFEEIAQSFGLTRARIQQIYYQATDLLHEKAKMDPELMNMLGMKGKE
jgi:DNA-binding XRE family transcriptional regulator